MKNRSLHITDVISGNSPPFFFVFRTLFLTLLVRHPHMFERLPVDMWVPDAVKQIAGHWIPLQHVSLQEVWHTLVKYFQIMKNPSTIKCIPHS